MTEGLDVVFDILIAGIKTIALVLESRNDLCSIDFCRRVYIMDFEQTEGTPLVTI